MRNYTRFLSVILLLAMVCSLFSFHTSATGTQPATYSDQYNSGTRDVTCTTLSGTGASDYYTGSYTFDTLSSQSESTLLQSLRKLMTDTHKEISSYDDCRDYADHTDCQNEDGKVVLLYTSYVATMSQYNGWNREHVWPKSLGGNNTSGGGADLHHIRPSDASVNSSRGNKKYGNVDGGNETTGNNPAKGYLGGYSNNTYFEPLDNVKGDVARICLYVYVRWGSDWGAESITDVFQSVDVLLEWMELDPVDTWEMGRNEVVEDIQGNRNVFIDYPELAWLLFGEEVPDGMVTPSSGTGSSTPSCTHAKTELRNVSGATCTTDGYTGDTYCTSCNKKLQSGSTISAIGHKDSNSDDTCDTCNALLKVPTITDGSYIKVTDGKLVSGQYVMVTANGYAPGVLDGTWITCVQPTVSGSTVTDPKSAVWTLIVSGSSVTLTDANGVTVAPKGGNNNGIIEGSYQWNWSASNGGFIFQGTGDDTVRLAGNTDYENQFRGYKESTATGQYSGKYPSVFTLYKLSANSSGDSTPSCTHTKTELRNASPATCTTSGYTGDTYCTSCGTKTASGKTINASGHAEEIRNKKDATCTVTGYTGDTYCKNCGQKLASGSSVSAAGHSDADKNNRCDNCNADLSNGCFHQRIWTQHAKDATCTEAGYTGDTYCEDCNEKLSAGTVIPASGHTDAQGDQRCDVCGADTNAPTEDPSVPPTEESVPPTTEHIITTVPATGPATVPSEDIPAMNNGSDPDDSSPTIWIVVGAVILLAAGIAVFIIMKKKKPTEE